MNKNDRWVQRHFGQLVDLYGGRYVAVSSERVVAVARRPELAERQARRAGCRGCPSVVRVPEARRMEAIIDPFRLFRFS